ncbi:2-succinyl-6-hydroxy-2,4-cyclohexadiene-1-carboxylate synthase [Radiobacillus kanasensis]|uniref:2-succinyl-6-hydroxy-2, 4-cyclohexadiene-1-carboxylate synthase n=1 Tax=Radiobacillus kanasensis TaxID=2844358 RepID=UPI001E5CECFE|nr:2-succinyl-6-hydroxy-2,4-cyclohexadiene-1-carboxylate synthase [Radiobacillus kanasensis]UFT98181.1 2-succinyl-6-hydroxy-2,4-cyclohexadiene-1-carboxylate synthase [Radiobacillus kanasensis]
MFVELEHGKYWVEDTGEGNPVLALHGFTGSHRTWDSFKKLKKYRVISLDLPGHGKTEVQKVLSMKELCDELDQLLKVLNLSSVCLLGYSMGGRIALSFAEYYPERVRALVLESSSPGIEESIDRYNRKESDERLAQTIEQEGMEAFVNDWESIDLFKSQQSLPESVRKNIRRERLQHTEKGLASSLRGFGTGSQPSWWDALSATDCPVQLIVGELDSKFVRIAKAMKKQLPACHLTVVSNVGHAVHVEDSRFFDTIVDGFLSNLIVYEGG